jgi:hypothetical protein
VKRYFTPLFVSFLTLFVVLSCNQDFYPVGEELLLDQTLQTETKSIPAFTYQKSLNRVQSNVQPLVQLGKITHPVFGKAEASFVAQLSLGAEPVFGNFRQAFEDEGDPDNVNVIQENETVKEVFLEIPFFANTNDTDNDGVIDSLDADPNDPASNSDGDELTDIAEFQSGLNPLSSDSDGDGILDHNDDDNEGYDSENRVYQIDSIYGNRDAQFNLQVHELTYFLNDLDPNNNFVSSLTYYSNRDYYEEGFVGATLFDDTFSLDFNEIRFNFDEDDPETPDVDETTQVETRLTPRLRIPLNFQFFQQRLLDLEGTDALSGNTAYCQAMRGLIIRAEDFSDDLYLLLDIQNAELKIRYEYDVNNTQGTAGDTTDDTIDKAEKEFVMRLAGNRITTLKNSAFDTAVAQRIEASKNNEPTDKLFIQSSHLHGKIRLFSDEDSETNELLEAIRGETLLINEANLVFYIDPETSAPEDLTAQRLYLFKHDSGTPLSDYANDGSVSNFGINSNKQSFGGVLERDESGKPYRYKFNLTNHISNIIRNDSLNYDLGLVVTANIENSTAIKAGEEKVLETIKYPLSATLNPLGAVLVGSHPDGNLTDKRVKLEIIYSSYK